MAGWLNRLARYQASLPWPAALLNGRAARSAGLQVLVHFSDALQNDRVDLSLCRVIFSDFFVVFRCL